MNEDSSLYSSPKDGGATEFTTCIHDFAVKRAFFLI